ncbi:MAG: putative DNA binding domain-containing protein [Flavobacteriales bacterium]|jgi:CRP-like cAMP-binding protein|nr:putative DNA binding domain-containing protein [Flavobacteriaceae bacterium]MDP4826469.1 putative DNA binding domain-containing protein [Flavobacteriales bacterium]
MKIEYPAFLESINASSLHVLSDENKHKLFDIHHHEAFNLDASVFRSYEEGRHLYIVHSGEFSLVLKNGVSKFMKRGAIFGEVATLEQLPRLGTVISQSEQSSLITFSHADLAASGLLPEQKQPNLLQVLFSNTVSYLHELLDTSIETLLKQGENEFTEFKEGALNPNILKAVAAFLNTKGGTLLLGVADDSSLLGIPESDNSAADKFDQDFQNLVREKLGAEAMSYVHFSHQIYHGKTIYRVDCEASHKPVYLNAGKGVSGEVFIIRSGATNQQLSIADAMQYIVNRFPYYLK